MKALNRKEVLVNAKANGTLDNFKPLTRDEAFTKKALGLGGGGAGGIRMVRIIYDENGNATPSMSATEILDAVEKGDFVIAWGGVDPDGESTYFDRHFIFAGGEIYQTETFNYAYASFISWSDYGMSSVIIKDDLKTGVTTVNFVQGLMNLTMRDAEQTYYFGVSNGELKPLE